MSHKDVIIDTDAKFEINPVTREINNASTAKTTIIQFDHNSERFGFVLPRYIEGHDMMDCNRVEIHYKNTDNSSKEETAGVYEVTDMGIDEEDETRVVFSWLVSQNATQRVGMLTFLVRFSCVAEDGAIEYAWNSSIFKGILVSTGMYNSGDVVKQYTDVLEQWKVDLSRIAAPYVETNGNWFKYDVETATYVDTGVKAEGKDGYTPRKGVDYWTEEDKAEMIAETAPFIVNVEVEFDLLDGSFVGVNGDKSYKDICNAASNGATVIARVYETGHVSLMEGDPIDILCLTKYDDKALNSGKAVFSSIKNNNENECEVAILTLKYNYGIETWSIEKTTLPSKEYVDNQIGNIQTAPFVVNVEIDRDMETGGYSITSDTTYDDINAAFNNGQTVVVDILDEGGLYEFRTANVHYGGERLPIIIIAECLLTQYEIVVLDDNTWSVAIVELASKNYVNTRINYQIGDIETALDGIIAIQNQLMGVSE